MRQNVHKEKEIVHQILFVVISRTNLLTLSALIDGLRAANDMNEWPVYNYRIVTVDGENTLASNGFIIPSSGPLPCENLPEHIIVVGSWEPDAATTKKIVEFLRVADRKGCHLYGVDHGVLVLAEGGFLDNRKATTHWEVLPAVQMRYPKVQFEEKIIVSDRNRTTCPGHTACLDLILSLVKKTSGDALSLAVSRELIYTRLRHRDDRQRLKGTVDRGSATSYLDNAISLMEGTVEAPMRIYELAKAVGVSCRQLENRFHSEFGCPPSTYYLRLRLAKSRQLLLYSTALILNVAFSCGFTSHSAFSRSFKREFGMTPIEYRDRFVLLSDRSYVE